MPEPSPSKCASLSNWLAFTVSCYPGANPQRCSNSLTSTSFFDALKEFCLHHPVFGTCAGTILLAHEVVNPSQRSLDVLDATVERNAYGRQIDSTILTAETELPGGPLEMVFIRAPRIVATGDKVKVLARREGLFRSGAPGQYHGSDLSPGALD